MGGSWNQTGLGTCGDGEVLVSPRRAGFWGCPSPLQLGSPAARGCRPLPRGGVFKDPFPFFSGTSFRLY